jgi:signal peptidase I
VDYVKRVIALPGQTFFVKDGQVFINGQLLPEPWEPKSWLGDFTGSEFIGGSTSDCPGPLPVNNQPITIPPGHIWVLGDHRLVSTDSRCFGPVPISSIKGMVMLIWWPFPNFRVF